MFQIHRCFETLLRHTDTGVYSPLDRDLALLFRSRGDLNIKQSQYLKLNCERQHLFPFSTNGNNSPK
jgi:hypothetical protein